MLDKRLVWLLIGCTMLLALMVLMVIVLALHFRKGKNDHFVERRRLLLANLEEGERMMDQIAKEVHDNIGQLSHLLCMTIDKIEKTIDRDAQIIVIRKARQLTDTIIFNADHVSNSLNSGYIKKRGLSNILEDDIELIKSFGKLDCRIEFHGHIRSFDPDKELVIYRIAQEAIHNTLEHAQASKLSVSLYYSLNTLKMEIQDNGIGFSKEIAFVKGIGLANMQERADLLQGKLTITSESGTGCCVTLVAYD